MKKKKILYLRTEIFNQELIAGGSVSHTLGIINGFRAREHEILCASSIMLKILREQHIVLLELSVPRIFSFLLWKINCLISNVFFTIQILLFLRKKPIDFIYQRHSILNIVGVIISKLKKIPLILEYNGSEVWVLDHWSKKRGSLCDG